MQDINKMDECPDCASTNIVKNEQREQIICRDCGLIFEPFVTESPIKETKKKTTKKALKKKTAKKTVKKPVKKTKATKKKKR